MVPIELTAELKKYQDKWVALSEDGATVYGFGNTAKEALKDAEAKGHDDPVLFYVRPFDLLYSGSHSVG